MREVQKLAEGPAERRSAHPDCGYDAIAVGLIPDLTHRDWRYATAYLEMARVARYRPQAPEDGFGNVLLSQEQCKDPDRLERETLDYVKRFVAEEDERMFRIGCTNFATNRAFIWVLEAARSLCGGADDLALQLLEMAVQEIRDESGRV